MVDDLFDVPAEGTVVLRLHVQPGAGRTAVVGRHGNALKVRVAAPPQGGRANAACAALVASLLGVATDAVTITSGESSRSKRVRVTGVDVEEVRRLLGEAVGSGNNQVGPGVRPPAHPSQ